MFELGVTLTYRDAQEVIIICDENDRSRSVPFNISPLNINYYNKKDRKSLKMFEQKLHDDIESIVINYTIGDPITEIEAKKRMERVLVRIEERDWLEAQDLFEKMEEIEPENWKINKEWGSFYRKMGKGFQSAREKLDKALNFVKHPVHKSEIYFEYALLYDSNGQIENAKTSFNQAEALNKNDKDLYLAQAKFYVDQGEPKVAMQKILDLMDIDKDYKDTQLWFDYLPKRINNNYKRTFLEYKKSVEQKNVQRGKTRVEIKTVPLKLPHRITWEDFKNNYERKIVWGTIESISEAELAFVSLNKDFTGVMRIKHLKREVRNKLRSRYRIKVRIDKAFISNKDGKHKIWLRYWYD